MNRVTITLHIDLPDGVVPDVDYGQAPAAVVAPPSAAVGAPQEFPPFPSDASSAPICKIHNSPMRPSTKPGIAWYCNKKSGDKWCTENVRA